MGKHPNGSEEDTRTAAYLQAEAFIKARRTEASADSTSAEPSATQPSSTTSESKVSQTTTGGGDVGNNNHGGPGGNGGDGADGFFSNPRWKDPLILAAIVGAFFSGIGLFILSIRTDPNKTLDAMIAKSTKASPPGWNPAPKTSSDVAPLLAQPTQAQSGAVIRGEMFSCSTQEEKEAGIKRANIQQIYAGQSILLTSGCALIQLNTKVTKFDAVNYMILVAEEIIPGNNYTNDRYSGNYHKCGDIGGNHNEAHYCQKRLNDFPGRPFLVIIEDGAHININ